ncbi:MAG: VWA domain-containing protein [Gemmataceae bacterium]
MRTRHRIPMIFSLSMMDMFCCTLGCVTFLWLVNQREAMSRAKAAEDALRDLSLSRSDLSASRSATDDLKAKLADAEAALAKARQDAEATRADLASARSSADELSKQLTDARNRALDMADRLSKKELSEQQLTKQQAAALARVSDLERLLRDRDLQAEESLRKLADMKKLADQLPDLRDAAASARESASGAESRVKALEKDLADARRSLDAAHTEEQTLAGQLARAKRAADERFEGIALTGRRVVFLVDMSGSMDLIDDKTPAPLKWPGVRDTILKVMGSLPQLEKFQVILFSDKVSYPLGQPGQWLDFAAASSADKVNAALTATRPAGNTNMYAALDAAFQYRAQGLDTVYLLSDGLPNVGEGLTVDMARTMTESQRTDVLTKAVRNALKTKWNAPQPGKPKVRLNSVGFFYESPDVGAFLWALSRENDGSFVGMSRP